MAFASSLKHLPPWNSVGAEYVGQRDRAALYSVILISSAALAVQMQIGFSMCRYATLLHLQICYTSAVAEV